jgi:DNA-binding MarR family transcriptional regulator
MASRAWLENVRALEQIGVLRILLFLLEGEKRSREFEEIMSSNTLTKARKILEDAGFINIEDGLRRRKLHSLTPDGKKAASALKEILSLMNS